MATLLAGTMLLLSACTSAGVPADETTTTTTETVTKHDAPKCNESFILNDNDGTYYNEDVKAGSKDKMTFSSQWGADHNIHNRFLGGDEHWILASSAGGQPVTCTIDFYGNAIGVYGHTAPTGGMMSVKLDGKKLDVVADFYTRTRIEAYEGAYKGKLAPVVKLEGLENKQHQLFLTLIDDKNPAQRGDVEVAIDYAVVTREISSNSSALEKTPLIEEAFKATIGDPYKYLYADEYSSIYSQMKCDGITQTKSLQIFQNDLTNSKIDIIVGENELELTAKASAFKTKDGKTLPASCIELSFLETIRNHGTNRRMFDILGDETRTFAIQSCGALWLTVNSNGDTQPGVYEGTITISGGETELSFAYTIEVVGLDISKADTTLSTELWMYPYSSNRYYSGKTILEYFGTNRGKSDKSSLRFVYLNDQYTSQLEEQIKLYAQAGGDVITATVVEDSWGNQTHDPYPSMVKWTLTADGNWEFDYTDFDKWVELNMKHGVNGSIKCYSLASWYQKIVYLDEASGKAKTMDCLIGSDLWFDTWTVFVTDFMAHVKEKGWFDITYLSMDERSVDEIGAVCKLVSGITDENGQRFKLSMAIYQTDAKRYFDYFDYIAMSSAMRSQAASIIRDRNAKGLTTAFYTCGATPGALTSQPYETVDFFYFSYKTGCTGYLRWALDAFNDEPLVNTKHWDLPAGDISLIYPDRLDKENPTVQSSVRYQAMIEAYKNIAALETMKTMSDEGAAGIDQLLKTFSGYSGEMQKKAAYMDAGMFKLAKQLLGN